MKVCRKCARRTTLDTEFVCTQCGGPLKTIKSNPLSEKRYGMFNIRADILNVTFMELQKLLAKVFITKCDFIYGQNIFVYVGVCEDFDIMPEGSAPPPYTIRYDEDIFEYRFEKAGKEV